MIKNIVKVPSDYYNYENKDAEKTRIKNMKIDVSFEYFFVELEKLV